jgi:hypothetical protein
MQPMHLDVVAQTWKNSRKISQHNLCTKCSCRQPHYADAGTDINDALTSQRLAACTVMELMYNAALLTMLPCMCI